MRPSTGKTAVTSIQFGVGLLEESRPELVGRVGLDEDQLFVGLHRQKVINHHVNPFAELPKSESFKKSIFPLIYFSILLFTLMVLNLFGSADLQKPNCFSCTPMYYNKLSLNHFIINKENIRPIFYFQDLNTVDTVESLKGPQSRLKNDCYYIVTYMLQ